MNANHFALFIVYPTTIESRIQLTEHIVVYGMRETTYYLPIENLLIRKTLWYLSIYLTYYLHNSTILYGVHEEKLRK